MMAKKLLSLHMEAAKEHQIDKIVDNLTSKLYYHGHPINRQEAREHIGLQTVVDPPQKVEKLMWRLYLDYEEDMELETPFDAPALFLKDFPAMVHGQSQTTNPKKARNVWIESKTRADFYEVEYELFGEKPTNAPGINVAFVVRNQGWKTA
jgi:hypothetical protein